MLEVRRQWKNSIRVLVLCPSFITQDLGLSLLLFLFIFSLQTSDTCLNLFLRYSLGVFLANKVSEYLPIYKYLKIITWQVAEVWDCRLPWFLVAQIWVSGFQQHYFFLKPLQPSGRCHPIIATFCALKSLTGSLTSSYTLEKSALL